MLLYRLVHCNHDPVIVGERLTRLSDHSKQKLGRGMYFALSESDARAFAETRVHVYDHLLECDFPSDQDDFYDLRSDMNAINKWRPSRPSADSLETAHDRNIAFCVSHRKKGLIWCPAGPLKWDELVVLEPFVGEGALIVRAWRLP